MSEKFGKGIFMNKIKRLFSCACILTLCFASNIGLPVKASLAKLPTANITKTDNLFYLYDGKILQQANSANDKARIADHYSHSSHSSHESHRSHYSSSY